MTKEEILAALLVEISIKRQLPLHFLVYDMQRPMPSKKFYAYIYQEIAKMLDKIYSDPDFYKEHFAEYTDPAEYVKSAIADYEKEYAEKIY